MSISGMDMQNTQLGLCNIKSQKTLINLGENVMKCIFCGNSSSRVVDSRYLKDTAIRRRRECRKCGKRFTTYETFEINPIVVTNVRNEREPFKLEKLTESLRYASYCRDDVDVPSLAQEIEKQLIMLNSQDVSTKQIVEVTTDLLMQVDTISALVYHIQHTDCANFDDVREFLDK